VNRARVAAFPGSFDPPTTAHLAVAEAAKRRFGLDRVDLIVSRIGLEKGPSVSATLEQRVQVLEELAQRVGWLGVVVSDHQLIKDLAAGYDVVVLGADKWSQVRDPRFYGGSPAARDDAVAALPTIAVAPRPPWTALPALLLEVAAEHHLTSSTQARHGQRNVMVPEARRFDNTYGVWSTTATD